MNWLHWSLLSALFAAVTALLAKMGVQRVDSHFATAVRTSVIVLFAWIVFWLFGAGTRVGEVSRKTWILLVLSGLASGASWLCYFRALQLGEVSKVAPIDKLSVVFVVALAAWWLGETVTSRMLAGVFLIASGAILLAWK